MKQKGNKWIQPDGVEIPQNRVTDYEKFSDNFGQKIAAEAEAIEARLSKFKAQALQYAEEMYTRYKASNKTAVEVNSFTFYTFDKQFKVAVDRKEQYVRVYRATKANPSSKEYTQINLDFASAKSLVADVAPENNEFIPLPKNWVDPATLNIKIGENTGQINFPQESHARMQELDEQFKDEEAAAIQQEAIHQEPEMKEASSDLEIDLNEFIPEEDLVEQQHQEAKDVSDRLIN